MDSSSTAIPFVSFCMSTFKRPVFLKQQLETILNQSFRNFEVVICDNDTEGSAQEIVNLNGDSRLRYYRNIQNLGMIKSFNRSIELSKGQFVVMITDDDPIYPDMLETLINLRNKFPDYGMYLGGCDWLCTDHKIAKLYGLRIGTNTCLSNEQNLNYTEAFKSENFVKNLFTFKIFPHYLWSTCMVKRSILIENGGVPDYGTPFLGDYVYLSIMGSHSGCVIINKSLGCQTLHAENFGRNQNDQLIIAAKKIPEYLELKMNHLISWPVIKLLIDNFVGIWLVSHLAFLNKYFKSKNISLEIAEKDIFEIEFMRKFKLKYFLKKRLPFIHDKLVDLKSKLSHN